MIKRLFILTMVNFLLCSCAQLNDSFDCPMKPGIQCKSLDEVNTLVDRGAFKERKACADEISSIDFTVDEVQPLRYGETVQRLWIAPYEDQTGNYHKVSEIFVITKPGHWLNQPLKEILNED